MSWMTDWNIRNRVDHVDWFSDAPSSSWCGFTDDFIYLSYSELSIHKIVRALTLSSLDCHPGLSRIRCALQSAYHHQLLLFLNYAVHTHCLLFRKEFFVYVKSPTLNQTKFFLESDAVSSHFYTHHFSTSGIFIETQRSDGRKL